jgi:hypothetical protein
VKKVRVMIKKIICNYKDDRRVKKRKVLIVLYLCYSVLFLSILTNSVFAEKREKNLQNMEIILRIKTPYEVKTGKICYVWFEANSESFLEKYILNAKKWDLIGRPIVTSRIMNVEKFVEKIIKSGIFVTSGFKTSDALKDKNYHDNEAWTKIAEVARNVSKLTNGRPVIIENEGAVKNMLSKGISDIDYFKLLESISKQSWPEIWFWYAPMGENREAKTISYNIAMAIINGIPNARLIEASSAGYTSSHSNHNSKDNLLDTLEIDQHPVSITYMHKDRNNFWKFEQIEVAIKTAQSNTVIVYPLIGVDIKDSLKKDIYYDLDYYK